tara:strand:+ start:493 stop:669 length:177 start_codon:yes stop_codon:yes gene_type:complete
MKTIDTLQKCDVWLLEDIIDRMRSDPAGMSLALVKIKLADFAVITEEIKNRTKNVLDK